MTALKNQNDRTVRLAKTQNRVHFISDLLQPYCMVFAPMGAMSKTEIAMSTTPSSNRLMSPPKTPRRAHMDQRQPHELGKARRQKENERRAKRTGEESESTTRLYNNWMKWLEENNYATPEQVQNFVGLRPSRRHVSARGSTSQESESDEDPKSRVPQWSDTEEESKLRMTGGSRPSRQHSLAQQNSYFDQEDANSKSSCMQWSHKKECGMAEDSQDALMISSKERRFAKFSASLSSLSCVAGGPRDTREDTDQVRDEDKVREEDKVRVKEKVRLEDKVRVEDVQHLEHVGRSNSSKRVTFLSDFVDYNHEMIPPSPRFASEEELNQRARILANQYKIQDSRGEIQESVTEALPVLHFK